MQNIVQSPSNVDSARFDALITRLRTTSEKDETGLLIEHLETAHADLHGAMPLECTVQLELARQAAMDLSDKPLKQDCMELIDEVLDRLAAASIPEPPSRQPSGRGLAVSIEVPDAPARTVPSSEPSVAALELTGYFHDSGVRFGTFYPNKHVVVVLESFELALAGRQRLRHAEFSGQQVFAASGEEFGKFLEDLRISRSLQGAVMTEVSRILDTEARIVDQYEGWARAGCGFIIASSPTEAIAWRISGLLMEISPVAAHWFTSNSIHSFT